MSFDYSGDEDPDVKYRDAQLPLRSFDDTNKTFLQFLEANGGKGIDPFSPEGVRLQSMYLQELQDDNHPLDVLRKISVNPFASPRDRISASKAILEYTMAKAPSKLEVSGPEGGAIKIDQKKLAALNDSELDTLLTLLNKAEKASGS